MDTPILMKQTVHSIRIRTENVQDRGLFSFELFKGR